MVAGVSSAAPTDSPAAERLAERLLALAEAARRHGFLEQAERVEQRRRDLTGPLLMMVVGEGKFGKSTLVNGLLGRDAAPVGRLPKTWKVDRYLPASERERAELFYRGRAEPSVMMIGEARAVCDEEELRLSAQSAGTAGFRSDLFQVDWHLRMPWLPANVALVDTPGFAQLRGDVQVEETRLYGAEGITIVATDAFEYYYYRADVVLWCFKATKLEDRDTAEALGRVRTAGKKILGVITHMDRLPRERWEETRARAAELFGQYVSAFSFAAAGAPDAPSRIDTMEALRSRLELEVLPHAQAIKLADHQRFLAAQGLELAGALDAIMKMTQSNTRQYRRTKELLDEAASRAKAGAASQLESLWEEARARALGKLGGLYDRADGDVARFTSLVEQETLDRDGLLARTNAILRAAGAAREAELQKLLDAVLWEGVRLGGGTARPITRRIEGALGNSRIEAMSSGGPRLTGEEGVAEGLLSGGAAAALGAVLLGPIGLAAAVVGFFVAQASKRSQCIDKAAEHLRTYCESTHRASLESLEQATKQQRKAALQAVWQSFGAHHGVTPKQLLERAADIDETLGQLDAWPSGSRPVLVPDGLGDLRSERSLYYHGCLSLEPEAAARWDAAANAAHTRYLAPVRIEVAVALDQAYSGALARIRAGDLSDPRVCELALPIERVLDAAPGTSRIDTLVDARGKVVATRADRRRALSDAMETSIRARRGELRREWDSHALIKANALARAVFATLSPAAVQRGMLEAVDVEALGRELAAEIERRAAVDAFSSSFTYTAPDVQGLRGVASRVLDTVLPSWGSLEAALEQHGVFAVPLFARDLRSAAQSAYGEWLGRCRSLLEAPLASRRFELDRWRRAGSVRLFGTGVAAALAIASVPFVQKSWPALGPLVLSGSVAALAHLPVVCWIAVASATLGALGALARRSARRQLTREAVELAGELTEGTADYLARELEAFRQADLLPRDLEPRRTP